MQHTAPAQSFFTALPQLFKKALGCLTQNDPLRMAGATAFFTSFALPFIFILLIQLFGVFVNPATFRHALFSDLSNTVGRESSRQIGQTLKAFRQLAHNGWITAFGSLFLLLVATTQLLVIKGSINQLWRIRMARRQGLAEQLRNRLQPVLLLLLTGLLVLLSILAEAAKAQMGQSLEALFPSVAHFVRGVLNYILSLLFVTLWFALLFRLLPDGRPSWRVAFSGAFVTAVLFSIGKHVLRLLLINSNIGSLYGASASAVLVLLFVFYSSLILYFGAAFTRAWAEHLGQEVTPLPHAEHYKVTAAEQ